MLVFVDIVCCYLVCDGVCFCLMSYVGWGLLYVLDGELCMLFGYGLLFGVICFVGDFYVCRYGLCVNLFDCDLDVIIVNGFGIDNCVLYLVGI